MDELTIGDKKYLSSKKAAQMTGYAKDYVGQLCREGRVDARLVGRNWYVLESSILEHRFGAEGQEPAVQESKVELDSTWKTPSYAAESVTVVPELAPKPYIAPIKPIPAQDSQKVLADMQSAWQEWFQSQEKQEKMLPDASEMLIETGNVSVEEPLLSTVPSEITEVKPEIQENIHIARHQEEEPAIRSSYDFHEETSRGIPVRRSPYQAPVAPAYSQRVSAPESMQRRGKRSRRSKRLPVSTFVLRALFLSIAGIAVVIALIGTGLTDRFISARDANNPISNFLGGVSVLEVNK